MSVGMDMERINTTSFDSVYVSLISPRFVEYYRRVKKNSFSFSNFTGNRRYSYSVKSRILYILRRECMKSQS